MRNECPNIDFAPRHGGDEFAILLPETDADGAEHLTRRIRERCRGSLRCRSSLNSDETRRAFLKGAGLFYFGSSSRRHLQHGGSLPGGHPPEIIPLDK
jgi:GGDEF domain-containing protein